MSNRPTDPQSQPLPPAPLIVIPGTGVLARPLSADVAELVIYGGPQGVPLVQASIALTAEHLSQLVDQLAAIRDTLTPTPAAGPRLVLPDSAAGGLVVPRG